MTIYQQQNGHQVRSSEIRCKKIKYNSGLHKISRYEKMHEYPHACSWATNSRRKGGGIALVVPHFGISNPAECMRRSAGLCTKIARKWRRFLTVYAGGGNA
jgi:hypothetical protein